MKQEIKDEALEQLELDIKFGFESQEQLFDSIRDMFYDEEDFDEDWLRQAIAERYDQHLQDSVSWKRPTDFDRLAKVFDELTREKIVCLHKAGHTLQDAVGDCQEVIEILNDMGIKVDGFCYYHSQDLARAVDKEIRSLYLGFDSIAESGSDALQIAKRIVAKLQGHGFEVNWPGTVDQRIEIANILWQKVPDNANWGAERVVSLLSKPDTGKKPFWKFW